MLAFWLPDSLELIFVGVFAVLPVVIAVALIIYFAKKRKKSSDTDPDTAR